MPLHMAENNSMSEKDIFDFKSSENEIKRRGMRIKWPGKAKKKENIQNWDMMMTLDVRLTYLTI